MSFLCRKVFNWKFIFFNWYKDIFRLSISSWVNFSNFYLIKMYPFYLHWISWHEFIHIIPLSFYFWYHLWWCPISHRDICKLCLSFIYSLSIYWSFQSTRLWFHWFFLELFSVFSFIVFCPLFIPLPILSLTCSFLFLHS